jgi:hypothetical protein
MHAIRTTLAILAWVLCVLSTARAEAPPATPTTEPKDVGHKYVRPAGSGPRTIAGVKYAYVATPEREAQIVEGFSKLKVGQTREEVRAALGPPDKRNRSYAKVKQAKPPFLGWCYTYKIKMRGGASNENNVCVQVFFNPAGKLTWAAPNVPGLKDVGSPGTP